ncbi:phospholipase D active site-containing protein [Myriangium duriaei CBS 260.36]|uniref:phospholipase D n=1 Tax=Myriangium duriaei CBS 260.36 TaxID=1168546 RepID=A0A9P4MJK4_9PEZI|nr:phospholipase D active site-containing protein [Myriangium duriaei CBS 260.36]
MLLTPIVYAVAIPLLSLAITGPSPHDSHRTNLIARSEVQKRAEEAEEHHLGSIHAATFDSPHKASTYRFQSFAPGRKGNQAKWYTDGCNYFWAISVALEQAKRSIWLLDWWLSPEFYLRRPPALNEEWRLDRVLQRAANRGVQIKVIVYKEVSQFIALDSAHTKSSLGNLHPNISFFRHPDHRLNKKALWSEFWAALKARSIKLITSVLVRLPAAALQALFGKDTQTTLYWAHHEKLCIIDGKLAFMGGMDMAFARWDTHDHPIADLHPGSLNNHTVWPGIDYSNTRLIGYRNVAEYEKEDLDRQYNARMGWTDMSLSVMGPVVQDLKNHFVQRWNWIYKQKYRGRGTPIHSPAEASRMELPEKSPLSIHGQSLRKSGNTECQILRSVGRWSHGTKTETSIMNAYIHAIKNSKHFVYIENQFFITACTDKQRPVKNKIGEVIVERILRAARSDEVYRIIVVMPAVPNTAAGDLKSDDAVTVRAVMKFQYRSISQGGRSIYEILIKSGIDPTRYIRFYNLRSYDRINHVNLTDHKHDNRYDSITSTYMTPRTPLYSIPWHGKPGSEIDAFVTEEVYVHTKLLIADDRVVITGSANLNDRSQMGDRDSEIAIYIEDRPRLESRMGGRVYTASHFAASLRRFHMRKHLGLVSVQNYKDMQDDPASQPVSRSMQDAYDWNSPEDQLVIDPLGDQVQRLWNGIAHNNTDAFDRVFRPVPIGHIRTWKDYDAFYKRFYSEKSPKALHQVFDQARKDGHLVDPDRPSTWKWGNVIAEDFPGGVEEVKAVLDNIRGTLVEMPLHFLDKDDIAKCGVRLNPITEEIYT